MNYLIACGGTGAHVALAMVRLHLLGYPLEFFRDSASDEPLAFPDLYLVDQDSGDGIKASTAWQAVRALLRRHSGKHNWKRATGRENGPEMTSVSPLPLGEKEEWYNPPFNTLHSRFSYSPMLELLASEKQRQIDYSLGMMGSPAVGSLLFRLKDYDRKPNGINHDQAYSTVRERCKSGRVVITGSGVGGTGASVAPTLASQCSRDGADVMAVMIQNWFKFDLDKLRGDIFDKATLRNRVMEENAATGLASYGQDLANNAAAVLVGVPKSALSAREYTSDNQQPIKNSHVHVVAALSAMQHFMESRPYPTGIYGMSASDQARLTGDIALGDSTLQDLVDKASVFQYLLDVFATVLEEHSSKPKGRPPKIYSAVRKLTEAPGNVGMHLRQNHLKDYGGCIEWLASLGVERPELETEQISKYFTVQERSEKRLERVSISTATDLNARQIASKLFQWTADWILEQWKEDFVRHSSVSAAASPSGKGYWPEQRGTGVALQWKSAGKLAAVKRDQILAALRSLYDPEAVSAQRLATPGRSGGAVPLPYSGANGECSPQT